MRKLFMVAMAAVFSVAMVSTGFAQGTTTEKKDEKPAATEKKAGAHDKMEKKDKKTAKKKAANPCAAKGDMKGESKDAAKGEAKADAAKK